MICICSFPIVGSEFTILPKISCLGGASSCRLVCSFSLTSNISHYYLYYRMASKANNNVDDPGAFEAREWLRKLVVGKSVAFETRKQGATAGDRVYGLLFLTTPEGEQVNLAVESVKNGHATPKVFGSTVDATAEEENGDVAVDGDPVKDYDQQLQAAFSAAKDAAVGVHSAAPLVRTLKTAGEDFETLALVERSQKLCSGQKVKCVIEYVFDGSRVRCHVTDEQMAPAGMQYGSFTLFLAGITCPRVGNPRLTPPTQDEPFAIEARQFVELRLLHRELDVTLHGTDKSGICAVGTIHHPRGNIAVELLKNGLARMSDWTVRMMSPMDVPALRIAENGAKVSWFLLLLLWLVWIGGCFGVLGMLIKRLLLVVKANEYWNLAFLFSAVAIGCFRTHWDSRGSSHW